MRLAQEAEEERLKPKTSDDENEEGVEEFASTTDDEHDEL